jgi:methyl-accepting chemotaxis protein
MKEVRKKIWLDNFQTKLFIRIGTYWLLYQIVLWNALFIWRLLREGPGNLIDQYLVFVQEYYPALICFAVVAPILALDAVRFAHRLSGPVYRLRDTVQQVAEGEAVDRIQLRRDDFLVDLTDDFNHMLESLDRRGVPVIRASLTIREIKQGQAV